MIIAMQWGEKLDEDWANRGNVICEYSDVQTNFWLGIICALMFNFLKIHESSSGNTQILTVHYNQSVHKRKKSIFHFNKQTQKEK